MSAAVSQPEDHPDPPRWRRLRQSVCLALLLIGMVVLARWVWGVRVEKQVAAIVADLRARGEPAMAEDLQKPPFAPTPAPSPDLYGQAVAAHVYTAIDRQWDGITYWDSAPTDADVIAMQRINAENGAARDLVRQARLAGAPLLADPTTFNDVRHLARTINFCALAEHYAGNEAEAVELLRDEAAMGKAMAGSNSSAIGCLVAVGLNTLACDTMARLADVLTLRGSSVSPLPGLVPTGATDRRTRSSLSQPLKPATSAQIRALIDDLLDEEAFTIGSRRGLKCENANILSASDPGAFATQSHQREWCVRLLWPMIRHEQVECLKQLRVCQDAIAQNRFDASLPAAHDVRIPAELAALPLLRTAVADSASFYYSNYPRTVQVFFRTLARRRATALLLAIHLYQLDYAGRLPSALSELTPGYLRQLPADPFRNDDNTFGYRPTARSQFIYSVGEDGIDNGGTVDLPPPYAGFGDASWRTRDEAFYIRWVRP